jgi:hypothetical protein
MADDDKTLGPRFFYSDGTPPFTRRGQLSSEYPKARQMTATTASRWADIFSQVLPGAIFTVYQDYGLQSQRELITYSSHCIIV